MKLILQLLFLSSATVIYAQGQYPFEQFPSIQYKEYKDWKVYEKPGAEKRMHFTLTIPGYFDNKDTLTIQLTNFPGKWDSSYLRIYRNKNETQKMFERMHFLEINVLVEPLRVSDINGDGLSDIKLVIPYMGNGLASLNQRVIYLFQKSNGLFDRVSYLDKMDGNRPERDLDGDGEFEIITMTLNSYKDHNYWTFNLYKFVDGDLMTQNSRFDYPIMIQFLNKKNYTLTDKISASKIKSFSADKPRDYEKD